MWCLNLKREESKKRMNDVYCVCERELKIGVVLKVNPGHERERRPNPKG
jgi:hypothetical protein